jgi:hypothetical protein
MAMRITPELRDQLVGRAAATGRSITQEMELLLEKALHTRGLLDQVFDLSYRDPHLVALLLTMGEAMRDTLILIKANADWVDDPNSFGEVACAAQQTIEAYRPIGQPCPNTGKAAVGMVRLTLHKISEGAAGIATAIRNRLGDTLHHRLRARQRSDDGWITPAPEEINQ